MELICPAGTPAAFRDAVDAGADAVYCGFRDETNARNFPGLNFSREELADLYDLAPEQVDEAIRFELIAGSERVA